MESTLSAEERSRIPTPDEAEFLEDQLADPKSVFMGQPVVADVDRLVTTIDWADGAQVVAAQPDCPRNVTATLTDADNSVTGLLTITGLDARGRTITETMQPLGDGNGKTLVGTKCFASITSIVISDTAGAAPGDAIVVGVGNVIGLPFDLVHTAGVRHVYLGGVRQAAPVVTTGASTSGINASAGTYDGSAILWAIAHPTKRS